MEMNWMTQNHKALFEQLAKSKDLTKVYDRNGVYSVLANNNVYPKLTLGYNLNVFQEQSFDNYFQAIEKREASPFIIFQVDENTSSIDSLLKRNGFRAIEEWTSMSIPLDNLPKENSGKLQIVKVENEAQLQQWLKVVEQTMFNNTPIETGIFEQLMLDDNINLWLGYFDNQPVCTLLSLINSNILGLYMLSTPTEFRGKGFGKELMLNALHYGAEKGISNSVLQATRLGINMYRKIGFQENGKFQIYWKVGKQYM